MYAAKAAGRIEEGGEEGGEKGRNSLFPPLLRSPPPPPLAPPSSSSFSSSSSSSFPSFSDDSPFPRFPPLVSSKGISDAGDEFWEAYLRAIDAEADAAGGRL